MEILQTIWTALTTPNESLIRIIAIPFTFLDAFVCMLFFTNLLNIETTKKRKLIYVIVYALSGIIISFFIPSSYTIFVSIILWPILIYFILQTTILKSILSVVVTTVLSSTLDFVSANIALYFFGIVSDQIMVVPLYRLSITSMIYLIIFLSSIIVKYFRINIPIFDNMHKKSKILLITNLLLMVVVIAMQFFLVRYYSDTMPAFVTLISIVSIIAYFAVSVYSIINSSKLEIAARDLEGANLTIHSLRVLHDTVRTFKHDFDNIVNSIGGYIKNDDMKGLSKYYDQLQQDCKKTNNLYSLSPNVINHPAIYNLLATKYYLADELNVQINLDIFLDLNEIEKHMKIYEFTRILGILLDNSIEAAEECEEKIINVTFRNEQARHRIVVIIENTYSNKDVDTDKIFEKGYTSKEKSGNSGLGLWKIRQILKKNNNLNLFTSKDERLFKQQFEIYY